jgi:hypothetical protein
MRFSGGGSEKKGTDTITTKWIIKNRTSLSSFFLRFRDENARSRTGAGRSVDVPFSSVLYITPKGEEKFARDLIPGG